MRTGHGPGRRPRRGAHRPRPRHRVRHRRRPTAGGLARRPRPATASPCHRDVADDDGLGDRRHRAGRCSRTPVRQQLTGGDDLRRGRPGRRLPPRHRRLRGQLRRPARHPGPGRKAAGVHAPARRSGRRRARRPPPTPAPTCSTRPAFKAEQTQEVDQMLGPDLRPAGPGHPHRPARHRQHAGPVDPGADPRARACCGRWA